MRSVKTSTSEHGQRGRLREAPAAAPSGRGHLERAVLEALWEHPEGITAAQVLAALEGREVAVTTVLTVLERLRGKGQVTRWRVGRSYRHRAVATREQSSAAAMLAALGEAADRSAALAYLVAAADAQDLAALRLALQAPTAGQVGPVCGPGSGQGAPRGAVELVAAVSSTGCGGASGLCGCCTCEPGCACCEPLAATG